MLYGDKNGKPFQEVGLKNLTRQPPIGHAAETPYRSPAIQAKHSNIRPRVKLDSEIALNIFCVGGIRSSRNRKGLCDDRQE